MPEERLRVATEELMEVEHEIFEAHARLETANHLNKLTRDAHFRATKALARAEKNGNVSNEERCKAYSLVVLAQELHDLENRIGTAAQVHRADATARHKPKLEAFKNAREAVGLHAGLPQNLPKRPPRKPI